MGHRELRRVPLDFAWPLRKVWVGYLNPHYAACAECPDCDGTGYSPTAFTHVPRDAAQAFIVAVKMGIHGHNSWLPEASGYRPNADEVNAWSLCGFGHDGVNRWVCVTARCARDGVVVECPRCGGSGEMWATAEAKAAAEAWTETEPPEGDGYQLWETCSEGSPVSPVFATLDALCEYAAVHCTTFADFRATAEAWREMLDAGYVRHVEQIGNVTAVF